jgi:hypothetical protein
VEGADAAPGGSLEPFINGLARDGEVRIESALSGVISKSLY